MESKAISTLNSAMRGRGRGGRGRGSRGRRGGLARGRSKKNMKVIESDEDDMQQKQDCIHEVHDENFPPKIDMEADISQLEAPTFTTINRGPPEPMLRLRWDHRVSLIGEKVLNPMIHCCDKCLKPILIYGRMIPCKHVFCLTCARDEEKACPKCLESVSRVEQTGLGTVFMCTHGGTRYGNIGCRRTYLSQRDLQAHINHRHSVGGDSSPNKVGLVSQVTPAPPPPPPRKMHTSANQQSDPRNDNNIVTGNYRTQSTRTNLITVPIQQDQPPTPHYHHTQVGAQAMGGQSGGVQPPVQSSVNYLAPQYNAYSGGYYQPPPPPPQPTQYPPPPPPQQYPPETQPYWPPHPPPPIQHHFYR